VKIVLKKTMEGGIIIVLSGELTGLQDADKMASEITEAYADDISYMVFDFANSSIPNSRFLGKMMAIYKLNKSRKVQTYIYFADNGEVRDLFKAAYVDHIIPIVAQIHDAAALSSAKNA
jgi:anti-anti-sigma regulatory factor